MTAFLFSCNNATCAVPEAFRETFRGSEELVGSPEGWEPGSLNLAQGFAMKFRTPLVHGDVTRLLIDFGNDGDARWSRFSLKLPETTRAKLVDRHERPYRTLLKQRIAEDLRRHAALLHVMVHTDSKTDGLVLLESPVGGDLAEKFSNAWRARLAAAEMDVRQVKAVPISDLGAELSREFPPTQYAQLKLSVSQSYFLEGRPWRWETVKKVLLETLVMVGKEVAVTAPGSPSTAPG